MYRAGTPLGCTADYFAPTTCANLTPHRASRTGEVAVVRISEPGRSWQRAALPVLPVLLTFFVCEVYRISIYHIYGFRSGSKRGTMGEENVKEKRFGFGLEREYDCRRAGHDDARRRQPT